MPVSESRRALIRRLFFSQVAENDRPAKTLVVVFLRGGADTLNIVVPYASDDYYRNRPTIAIKKPGDSDGAIKLDEFYGFHPALGAMTPLFQEGRLALIQGVGHDNPSGSHFECMDQVEHGESYGKSIGGGWLGRHLRSRPGPPPTPLSAVAIGTTLPESLRNAPAASAMRNLDELDIHTGRSDPKAVVNALQKLYQTDNGLLGNQGSQTIDLFKRVGELKSKPYVPSATYPGMVEVPGTRNVPGASLINSTFAAALKEVARLIKARVGLEVACVDLGGWDTHFVQGGANGLQASQIRELGEGLAAFDLDMKDYRKDVSVLVMTEFGRRIEENTSLGTDHGRGYAAMAFGGGITGGRVFGQWPGVVAETEPGPGGIKMQVDYRTLLSEMLTVTCGNPDLNRVFPGFTPGKIGLCDL